MACVAAAARLGPGILSGMRAFPMRIHLAAAVAALAAVVVIASCGGVVDEGDGGIDGSQSCSGFPHDCHWPGECYCECGWMTTCVAGQWTCGETPAGCVKLCAPLTCPCMFMEPGCGADAAAAPDADAATSHDADAD